MPKTVKFSKYQGLGNDFIIVDDREGRIKLAPKHIVRMCDRHYGIGSDQFMIVKKSESCDFRMDLYNRDGSLAEMSGNGIRCFARYLFDKRITRKKNLEIDTDAGVIKTKIVGAMVEVDMGEPITDGPKIPINRKGQVINQPLQTDAGKFSVTAVSMGNPHAVIFVKDASIIPLEKFGPVLENHAVFPKKVNVHFAQVVTRKKITVRTWERGTGVTLACGTGACAVAVAGILNGFAERDVAVRHPGGTVKVRWDEKDNRVYMKGPTEKIFEGTITV